MRRWIWTLFLSFLIMGGLHSSAWANSELHTGGRLFFPQWDVSTPNRLTFIVVTRKAKREGSAFVENGGVWQVVGSSGSCLPRGASGSTSNVNRTDLGGTLANPVFVDDVHFTYYGQSCTRATEVVHMSCADIDLFLLASPDNTNIEPRNAFSAVAGDGRGALDVHFVTNGQTDPNQRKLENSLLGHAIISDVGEGWAATFPAAAAKALPCPACNQIVTSGKPGTQVGYENYPMEVYLPFALAEPFPTQGGDLRNLLSLWGPGLLPGADLSGTAIILEFVWWDGRERTFTGSIVRHSLIEPLGGPSITGLDPPLDSARFNAGNFVCGHTTVAGTAENDGFPRTGTSATACGPPDVADTTHPSDNIESIGDLNVVGHRIQSSTPIAWWRFTLRRDGLIPAGLDCGQGNVNCNHSGRGLVGVVLSSAPGQGQSGSGIGDATRLWHDDPCEVGQSSETIGPPHERDRFLMAPDFVALFNVFTLDRQKFFCSAGGIL